MKVVRVDSLLFSIKNMRASGMGKRTVCDKLTEMIVNNTEEMPDIVYCKDCKYWHDWHCVEPIISPWEGRTNKSARSMNDYCSYSEHKDGESE